jgi:hypothetical protein
MGIKTDELPQRATYQAQYARDTGRVPQYDARGAMQEAQGVADLGQGVQQAGQALAKYAQQEMRGEMAAQLATADAGAYADVQALQSEVDGIVPDGERRFITDPTDPDGVVVEAEKALKDIRQQHSQGITYERLRTDFGAQYDKMAARAFGNVMDRSHSLLRGKRRAETMNAVTGVVTSLGPGTSQESFEDAMKSVDVVLENARGVETLSDEEAQAERVRLASTIRSSQVRALIDQGRLTEAQAAARDLPDLTPSQRSQLAGHASALLEKSRREAAQAREDKARSLWASHKDALASIYEHGDEGNGDLEKTLRALGDHDRADQWARERDLAYKTHNLLTSMDGMPLEDQERRVREAFSFQPGETGAAAKASARERALDAVQSREREKQAALRQVDQVRRQWAKDPAAMAIKDVRKNLPENATPYAEAQASMAKQREVLKGTGIQPRVLSNEASKQFADSYEAADGRNRLGMLTELRREYKDLYPNVAGELGLGVETDMALDALDSGGAQAFADAEMLVAQVKESELGADKDLAKDVRSAAQDVWKADPVFQAAWGLARTLPGSSYHARYASEVFRTYQNLALRMGDADKAQAVFDRIYGAVADPDIGYVTWPRSQAPDPDAVAGGLEFLRRSANVAKNTPENIRWVRAYGTWVNNGDRFSLLDPRSGELCRTPAGDIYAVSLGDVLRAGKAAADFREQLAAQLRGTLIDGSANVLPTFSAPVGTTAGKPDANTSSGGEEEKAGDTGRDFVFRKPEVAP